MKRASGSREAASPAGSGPAVEMPVWSGGTITNRAVRGDGCPGLRPGGFIAARGTPAAAGQIGLDEGRPVRAILVAPELARGAEKLLKEYGYEYRQLTPQRCSEVLKEKREKPLTAYFR